MYPQIKPSAASSQAMLFTSCSGLVILLILRGTSGDTVTQTEGSVTLPEGTPLTLNCTYQSSYSVVAFWYVQYQNKEPKLLLKSSSENRRVENHGFQASLKSDKSFHLEKRSVQMSDSAVYYCAVEKDTNIGGNQYIFGKGTSLKVLPSEYTDKTLFLNKVLVLEGQEKVK